MEDEEKQTLFAEAILGRDAEDFFKSEIGKYILARADEKIKEHLLKLREVDPRNTAEIMCQQFQINCAEGAIKWLNDMIRAGKQALGLLEDIEDAENDN